MVAGAGSVCTSGGGPGLQNQWPISVNPSADKPSENDAENSAFCLALLARKSADLALLVKRWDRLPEAIRAGILAMVKAAGKGD